MTRLLSAAALAALLIGALTTSALAPRKVIAETATSAPAASHVDLREFPALSAEHDWPWWRGPNRSGIAPDTSNGPTKWSDTQNVVWKAPVPGRGHASPTIVGDHIFLATADDQAQTQSVVAFDRRTGRQRWQRTVSQGGFPEEIHSKNTHATSTVASDGERLFVAFFHHKTIQATALSLDGKTLWQETVGQFEPRRYEYGYAPSPVVYRGTVIVTGEYDGDAFIAALDRASGDEVWRIARPSNVSYSSPVVAHVAGRDQLLISGADQVTSYDPATGRLLWSVKGTTAATCGTVVWEGDMVFASGGFPGSETIAIRASGSGEVVWRNKQRSYEQSLLAHAGYLYGWTDSGVMYCWRTSDGQEMWKKRLQGPISASPIFAGGQVYWSNERGTTFVFRPNPEQFDLVAENKLGDDSFASPAVSRGQLFLRVAKRDGGERQEFLYCIGKVETP